MKGAEGKTSCEMSWKAKVMKKKKRMTYPHPGAYISLARLPIRNITAKNNTTVSETHPDPTEV